MNVDRLCFAVAVVWLVQADSDMLWRRFLVNDVKVWAVRPEPCPSAAVCRRGFGAREHSVQPYQPADFELVCSIDFVVPRRDAVVDFLNVLLHGAVDVVDSLNQF